MHIPVMLNEILTLAQEAKSIVDLTYGAGGHSKELLKQNKPQKFIAFDQDPRAKDFVIEGVSFFLSNFRYFHLFVKEKMDFILADLGMSLMQLTERGFSFMRHTDLDLSMKQEKPLSFVLEKLTFNEIYNILKVGEVRNSLKLAKKIEYFRLRQPIHSTTELVEALQLKDFGELARVFQAFRIFLNDEISALKEMVPQALLLSRKLAIITFNSIEDRIVKKIFKASGKTEGLLLPSATEISLNPSSRSAKLRFCIE